MTGCRACGVELRAGARFCDACGTSVATQEKTAEYKQVTVLFADVVRSMDIAAAVGPERLREIMGSVFDRCATVVQRYGGTVNSFTGDGIMAVFGAPMALEDHAFRACLAALDIQAQLSDLDADLRVGVNSGEVIAGDIGSGTAGYTAIGEQVGMAQRMESVAPPGGVMLSESTARLVEHATILGAPELVHIKGSDAPVPARRLLSISHQEPDRGRQSPLVGRAWELNTITALLDEIVTGAGCVVTVAGPAGIGKSRLVRESVAIAADRDMAVFGTYCESHTGDVAFHVVARLLRATTGINNLDAAAARDSIRAQVPDADPEDLLLLDDLLGIGDPAVGLPDVAPDARRRRLTALINAASLARTTPTVYVVEDVHWIDQASEALIAGFLSIIPHTPSLVLITYRPEYTGALAQLADAQSLRLRPLSNTHCAALTAGLLGADPSLAELGVLIAEKASGNPFFVEEIVHDLAGQGVLDGGPGAYVLRGQLADVTVPATLQAAIAARIDRLDPAAKHTLNAAAVIGARFTPQLLASLVPDPAVDALIDAQLVDQVRYTPYAEYAFRHPLIQQVAYASQLKSARAELHRRLVATIEQTEENAALIAEHLEAAGELPAAYDWHMRAGTWSTHRDITAAHLSWHRARDVADRLPTDDPNRPAKRIAPRTLLCATAFRFGSGAHTGFDELRDLCIAAGNHRSLATGMAGQVVTHYMGGRRAEAAHLAAEHVELLESIGDPTLMLAVAAPPLTAWYETGQMTPMLHWAQRVIDLADGDIAQGDLIFGSPLSGVIVCRGAARWCHGLPGWRDDFHTAIAMSRQFDAYLLAAVTYFAYPLAVAYGTLLPDADMLRETVDLVDTAERFGDNLAVNIARTVRGVALVHSDSPERAAGFDLLAQTREQALDGRYTMIDVTIADIHVAREQLRTGNPDAAIGLLRATIDDLTRSGGSVWWALAVSTLVEALLVRGHGDDLREAQALVDQLAALHEDTGLVLYELPLLRLRALLAQARGDDAGYRDFRHRYRKRAIELGFEGHMAVAEGMP